MTKEELQEALAGPITSLLVGQCIIAWYSAQLLYVTHGGILTPEKKQELWTEVCSHMKDAQLKATKKE